jgi:hypothetical protein
MARRYATLATSGPENGRMVKRRGLGALLVGSIIGCTQLVGGRNSTGTALEVASSTGGRPPSHVVLIAIDGTRWQEVFRGTDPILAEAAGIADRQEARELVPNIQSLAERGIALGDDDAPVEASGPNFISLPGYTEILSGRPSRCQENACDERPEHTLADSFREAGAATAEVAVFASWDRVEHAATHEPGSILVSTGRTHGENRKLLADDPALGPLLKAGEEAAPNPGHDDYRPDAQTAALATAFLSERRPRFVFIALGDTDEYAHSGDYAAYLAALRHADKMVGDVISLAAEWESQGEGTLIMVTTDHGREAAFRAHGRAYPESARTWLVGAGGGLSKNVIRRGARHRLADIAPTIETAVRITPRADDDEALPVIAFSADPGPLGIERGALARNR